MGVSTFTPVEDTREPWTATTGGGVRIGTPLNMWTKTNIQKKETLHTSNKFFSFISSH